MRAIGGLPRWLRVIAVCVAAAANVPLLYLILRGFDSGPKAFVAVLLSSSLGALLWRTLALVVGVVVASVLIAVPAAWLVARTDLPGRRLWALLAALPLVVPSYVAAFSLVVAFGPRGGLQGWLEPFGVDRLPAMVYGYGGALAALTLFNYPYLYLLTLARLRRIDPALEETARSLGSGCWSTFFRVVLPSLAPAISAGGLLVALYTLSDFGAVSIVRYPTFTLSIYTAYRALFDRSVAAALGCVLVVLTLAIVGCESWFRRQSRPLPPYPQRRASRVELGRWRWPCLVGMALLVAVTLGVPVLVVGGWGVRGLIAGVEAESVWAPLRNSLSVSVVGATATVLLALPVSIWVVRQPSRWATAVGTLTHSGYALPGIVVALAIVFVSIRAVPFVYQTLPLLVAAYVIRFLPQAIAACQTALAAVSPRFEEAARGLGRRPAEVLRTVTLPMIRPGLVAGAGLVFLTIMKELPATLILRPTGYDTLATEIWGNAAEGFYAQASVPALLLVAASVLPIYGLVIRPALADRV